jgi:molybdopterin converting factor small subunit
LEKLHGDFPALRDYTFVMALNKKTLHESSPLQDGDLVALLPAFSGG